MGPNDVQAILNCINNLNRAIDYKQWEHVSFSVNEDVMISFQRSSIPKNSLISSQKFQVHLQSQLTDIKSMHRDYNFFIKQEDGIVKCNTDFKIETYTEDGQLITGASGSHQYHMKQVGGKWKIAGIFREITRLDQPAMLRQYQRYAS